MQCPPRALEADEVDEHIQRDIELAARLLKESGAAEVYAFGSAAHGEARDDSDIDLAVRGLAPQLFFRAMSAAAFAVSRPIDLIDLDEHNPFTDYLLRKGGLIRVG